MEEGEEEVDRFSREEKERGEREREIVEAKDPPLAQSNKSLFAFRCIVTLKNVSFSYKNTLFPFLFV